MDFVSKTKFNAPIEGIEGCELKIRGGVSIGLEDAEPQIKIAPWDSSIEIDQKVTIKGDVEIRDRFNLPILSIDPSEQAIDIIGDIQSVNNINTCGTITVGQNLVVNCSINTSGVITSGRVVAHQIDASETIYARGGCISHISADHIALFGSGITSWADLSSRLILRFTSPELPANCSQFCFEGCGTVTGTELPFIQVRETATGKLVKTPEMDVWVNLDKTCTAYTLGKPVAEVEPCTSAIEAGKWTAIVMN